MDISMEGYLRFVLALVFVLGLIAVFAALARRAGWGFPATAIRRASDRRIGTVEVTPLDGRRRLVLIRRDDVEHLLLLSPNTETVIETGIRAAGDFRLLVEKEAAQAPASEGTEAQS